jgi:hypothetical protein
MNTTIIINVTGILRLDEKTTVKNPIVSVTSANDNYINSEVSTASVFTSNDEKYNLSRATGSFNYVETWTDEDVKNCVENWINEHRVTNTK